MARLKNTRPSRRDVSLKVSNNLYRRAVARLPYLDARNVYNRMFRCSDYQFFGYSDFQKQKKRRTAVRLNNFNFQFSTPHIRYHHPLCRAAAHQHKVNPCRGHSETQHPHSPRLSVQTTPRNIIDAHRLALRTANNDI